MKRNKYICVSFTQEEARELQKRADAERRPLANFIYLIISDYLRKGEGQQ